MGKSALSTVCNDFIVMHPFRKLAKLNVDCFYSRKQKIRDQPMKEGYLWADAVFERASWYILRNFLTYNLLSLSLCCAESSRIT